MSRLFCPCCHPPPSIRYRSRNALLNAGATGPRFRFFGGGSCVGASLGGQSFSRVVARCRGLRCALLSFSELHLSRDGPEGHGRCTMGEDLRWRSRRGRRGVSGVGPLESESCESGGPLSFPRSNPRSLGVPSGEGSSAWLEAWNTSTRCHRQTVSMGFGTALLIASRGF